MFVISHKKKNQLIEDPPAPGSFGYGDWVAVDACIMTWLVNSMEPSISTGIIFMKTAKVIWDHLKELYANKRNISHILSYISICSLLNKGMTAS